MNDKNTIVKLCKVLFYEDVIFFFLYSIGMQKIF